MPEPSSAAGRRLIVVMIDGVSADHFARHRSRLPHLSALAARGTLIERLPAAVPGTSMPGRTSILTGVDTRTHGVSGNHVFDGETFHCAGPGDLRVPTIAGVAHAAGLDVASAGFAMVDPDDTTLYLPAWWLRDFVSGSRFAKVPASRLNGETRLKDSHGRLAEVGGTMTPPIGVGPSATMEERAMAGYAGDLRDIQATAGLACSATPPDLILTEINMPDQIQHQFGFESDQAHWSVAFADALVGTLVQRLTQAGKLDDTVLAITSDHGHGPVETAIHPDVLIPGALWESEGATLHVVLSRDWDRAAVTAALMPLGVQPWPGDHLPAEWRDRVAAFVAPPAHSFEPRPVHAPEDRPTGPAFYTSTHGMKPGTPSDDRFCIFAGPGVATAVRPEARAEDLAPTFASLLGIAMPTAQGQALL